ncbi:MAG: hypothetical protein ACK5HA_15350 [Planctomycetaceae bacterium]|jgi:hypothetical protein
MLGIALDALVLMLLLKTVNDDEIGFGPAFGVALVASIGVTLLSNLLFPIIGLSSILVAGLITASLLGLAVSSLFGVEIKRSVLIGAIFVVVHIGIGVLFLLMFR